MPTLIELRAKYNFQGGNYEPNPSCKHCNGQGERFNSLTQSMMFCICLYVDHDMSDFAGTSLGETARKLRQELNR